MRDRSFDLAALDGAELLGSACLGGNGATRFKVGRLLARHPEEGLRVALARARACAHAYILSPMIAIDAGQPRESDHDA